MLTLSNPSTILSFVAVFVALAGSWRSVSATSSWWLVGGVFTGSTLWWRLLSQTTARLGSRLDDRWRRRVNQASAALLVGFALWQLGSIAAPLGRSQGTGRLSPTMPAKVPRPPAEVQPPELAADPPQVQALQRHPGLLLRRAHQIAAAMLLRDFDGALTPPQFSALDLVSGVPGIDMMGVSRVIGLDRTTTALVINNLVKLGLVTRQADNHDRRRSHLVVTGAGTDLLAILRPLADRSEQQLMGVFSGDEQRQFAALLERFVRHFNQSSPAPVDESAVPRTRSRLRQRG